jgi:hypothetical protein
MYFTCCFWINCADSKAELPASAAGPMAGVPPNARLQRLYTSASQRDVRSVGADGSSAVPAAPLSVQLFLVSRWHSADARQQ